MLGSAGGGGDGGGGREGGGGDGEGGGGEGVNTGGGGGGGGEHVIVEVLQDVCVPCPGQEQTGLWPPPGGWHPTGFWSINELYMSALLQLLRPSLFPLNTL